MLKAGIISYIKEYPDSFVSLYWLSRESQFLLKDSVKTLLPLLSKNLLNHRRVLELIKNDPLNKFNLKMSNIPEINLVDMDGNKIVPDFIKDKVILWDFWGTWCKPCLISLPKIRDAYGKMANKEKIVIIGVVCDDIQNKEKLKRILTENNIDWPNVNDVGVNGKITSNFGIYAYPTYVISNSHGKIVDVMVGEDNIEKIFVEIEKYIDQ